MFAARIGWWKSKALRLRVACNMNFTRIVPLLSVLALQSFAQIQNYQFTTNNGTITLTKYTGPTGDIVIPDKINELPVTTFVTEIFDPVFKTMTSVTIPNTITRLPMWAIEHCDALTTVNIPASVTRIDGGPFYSCLHLQSITVDPQNPAFCSVDGVLYDKLQNRLVQYPCARTGDLQIPESVTNLDVYSIYGSVGLSSVTIPRSLTSLPGFGATWGGLFSACSALTNVVIPDSVTNIGACAFNNCTRLAAITIPDSVVSIGTNAFMHCAALTSISIPKNVAHVAGDAFENCNALQKIVVDANNTRYSSANGVLLDKNQAQLIIHPGGQTGEYTIPDNISSIGKGAFRGNYGLTSVTIPSSVTNVGEKAFANCGKLKAIQVDARNPVYSSVDGVLFDKQQTKLLLCPAGKTGDYTIPGNVTSIENHAFMGCAELTGVTIPDNLAHMGESAFENCRKLRGVTIPSSVTFIGDKAFQVCANLTNLYFKGNAPALSSAKASLGSYGVKTVFYLPTTTGWGSTFGNIPTAIWKP